jgi:hypothetical protein
MLKKLLATLGLGTTARAPAATAWPYAPYAGDHVNFLYNLLFCDDLALFKAHTQAGATEPWATLFADQADIPALRAIADDAGHEGRVRALAFNRLRAAGATVPAKTLIGVIIEVPLAQGLDVLAAFAEGGVRYLNQSGRIAVFEGQGHPVEGLAKELVAAAQPIVDRIGPWDRQRLPPPPPGNVRMTFLVSDGLYFGEGPFGALQADPVAGPLLAKATELLQRVVALGTS